MATKSVNTETKTNGRSGPQRRGRKATALVLAALVFAVYMINCRTVPNGDCGSNTMVAVSLARDGDFYLDEFEFLYTGPRLFTFPKFKDRHVSVFPTGTSIIATPVFFVADKLGMLDEEHPEPVAKVASSMMLALAAMLVFLVCDRFSTRAAAVVATIIYTLAVGNWAIVSQDLWQHSGGQLCLAAGIYLLVLSEKSRVALVCAGFVLGYGVVCRPVFVIPLGVLGLYGLIRFRWRFLLMFLGAVPAIAFLVCYNLRLYSHILGGYGIQARSIQWGGDPLKLAYSQFLGPARGLVSYSPVMIFALIGLAYVLFRKGVPLLCRFLVVTSVLMMGLYIKFLVQALANFGTRFLMDPMPAVAVTTALFLPVVFKKRVVAVLLVLTLAVSIFIQAVGAFTYDDSWYIAAPPSFHPVRYTHWRDAQLLFYLGKLLPSRGHMYAAGDHLLAREYYESEKELLEHLKTHNDELMAWYWLGYVRLEQSKITGANEDAEYNRLWQGADEAFDTALRLDPNYTPAMHGKMDLLYCRACRTWNRYAAPDIDSARNKSISDVMALRTMAWEAIKKYDILEFPDAYGMALKINFKFNTPDGFCSSNHPQDLIRLSELPRIAALSKSILTDGKTIELAQSWQMWRAIYGFGLPDDETRPITDWISVYLVRFMRTNEDVEFRITWRALIDGRIGVAVKLDWCHIGTIKDLGSEWRTDRFIIPAKCLEPTAQALIFLTIIKDDSGMVSQRLSYPRIEVKTFEFGKAPAVESGGNR